MIAALLGLLYASVSPASDGIWRDRASDAILGYDKFWDVPVRVENVRRDESASAGEFALEYCEGGVWIGDQIIRRDQADTAPQCVWGDPQEGCHFRNPCIEECGPEAWGCRVTAWACCWITFRFGLACDASSEAGRECLWEET